MFIDLTIEVTPKLTKDAKGNESKANFGHLGTHFDVMNKEFPLAYIERRGVVFDVQGTDEINDVNLDSVKVVTLLFFILVF